MSTNRVFFSPTHVPPQNQHQILYHSPHRQQQIPRHQNAQLDIKSMKQRLDMLVKQAESILPREKRPTVDVFTANSTFTNSQTQRGNEKGQQKSRSIRIDNKPLINSNIKSPMASSTNIRNFQEDRTNLSSHALFQNTLHKRQNSSKIIEPNFHQRLRDVENPEANSQLAFKQSVTLKKSENKNFQSNSSLQFNSPKTSQTYEKKAEPEISWTKYLSLEFKNEELQENLKKLKEQLECQKKKSQNIKQELLNAQRNHQQNQNQLLKQCQGKLECQRQQQRKRLQQKDQKQNLITKHYNDKLKNQKQEYEKKLKQKADKEIAIINDYNDQLAHQKTQYENILMEKNNHIRQLVQKYCSIEKGAKGDRMNVYIEQILAENERLNEQLKIMEQAKFEYEKKCENFQNNAEYAREQAKAMRKQIQTLKIQSQKIQKILVNKKTPFEQVIKSQLEETKSVRERIEVLQEENTLLKQKINDLYRQMNNQNSDKAAIQLREKTLRNKLITQSGITITNKDNEIQTLSRKLSTLEQKYKLLVNEIKQKDLFLQQHLVGRTDQIDVKEYIMNMLKMYEDRFTKENNEEKYLQEIERLKLKLSLFERNW